MVAALMKHKVGWEVTLYIHEASKVFLDQLLFLLLGFHLFCETPLEVFPVEVVERCKVGLGIVGGLLLVVIFRGLVGGIWLMLGLHPEVNLGVL